MSIWNSSAILRISNSILYRAANKKAVSSGAVIGAGGGGSVMPCAAKASVRADLIRASKSGSWASAAGKGRLKCGLKVVRTSTAFRTSLRISNTCAERKPLSSSIWCLSLSPNKETSLKSGARSKAIHVTNTTMSAGDAWPLVRSG